MISLCNTQNNLLRIKKKDLAYIFANTLNLLFNETNSDGAYNVGWNDSRKCIIDILNLEKYIANENV